MRAGVTCLCVLFCILIGSCPVFFCVCVHCILLQLRWRSLLRSTHHPPHHLEEGAHSTFGLSTLVHLQTQAQMLPPEREQELSMGHAPSPHPRFLVFIHQAYNNLANLWQVSLKDLCEMAFANSDSGLMNTIYIIWCLCHFFFFAMSELSPL